jgi:TolB-like protein/tetratricopeptide (TPR) repeat protein
MMNKLFAELRRRNIFRIAGVYAVVGWIIMQVVSVMTPALNLPDWVDSFFAITLIIGFPITLLLAWAFEMTPEGVKRTEAVADGTSIAPKTGRKLDFAILGGLVIVGALIIGGRFLPQKSATPEITQQAQTDERPSIAVMPFEDFSSGKDQEYFANGVSEELLNVLARIDGLKVSSRTSSFAFKERDASTKEIAEALNVKHLLEGSIRKSGTTLRITAQLIDASNDQHMWSETYDRPLTADNIFAIQDEIAVAIVAELKGKLSLSQTTPDPSKQTPRTHSLEAYELYLRARQQMNQRKPDTLRAAVAGFKQVIALDPQFAPAYSGLADTYLLMPFFTDMQADESARLAKPHVERALQLAPHSAESLVSTALLAMNENEYEKAATLADRAIAANPNHADAYLRKFNATWSDSQESLAAIQKAQALDPLSAVILSNLGYAQLQVGDRDGAKKTMLDNMRWNPDSPFGLEGLALLSFEDGDIADAHSLYMDALALNPEGSTAQNALANIYFSVGMYGAVSTVSKQPSDLALALFLRGQKEEALKLAREHPDNPRMNFALFASGDVKGAYPGFRKFVTDNRMVEGNVTSNFVLNYGYMTYIFKENGDADADILVDKLQSYFGGDKAVEDFNLGNDLRAGILLQLIKGDEDAAYAWIDRFLDLGFADEIFFTTPPFDGLRGTPEYARREARMKQNTAKHRAEIEAQLANPKPNWVKN